MTIKVIGFDLDGTLVDSALGLANTVDNMCERLGLPKPGKALVTTWIGNGIEVLLDRALLWADAPKDTEYRQNAMVILSKCYQDELLSGSPLFPDVKETLEQLYSEGHQLVLITNKPSKFVPDLMDYLGISHLFSMMLGASDSVKIKPHPTPIFKVLGELGVMQSEFVFVGDSRNDILAAKNAGVTSIALTYGYNYGEPISNESPDYIIHNFAELLPLIHQLKD
ncbi:phosphoglycolate phosphatase [Wohlfahrtiimonas larvae]|uniref:phosphoglycolate phosphatase n=1 Tax=Wohlfahrtiimonas larvae TaxID=1157986 RepID=A0ABP9MQR8_9GAMM|nr:phosphoglycolate phosphatase [Wohlfahrtiimonas larvae]